MPKLFDPPSFFLARFDACVQADPGSIRKPDGLIREIAGDLKSTDADVMLRAWVKSAIRTRKKMWKQDAALRERDMYTWAVQALSVKGGTDWSLLHIGSRAIFGRRVPPAVMYKIYVATQRAQDETPPDPLPPAPQEDARVPVQAPPCSRHTRLIIHGRVEATTQALDLFTEIRVESEGSLTLLKAEP